MPQFYDFVGLPPVPIAEGATTPVPDGAGNLVWSTVENDVMKWTGTMWTKIGPLTGTSEEQMAYAKHVDWVSDSVFYQGQAVPGSLDTAPVWRISKTTMNDEGDATTQWADGTADFSKIWNNRLTYTYQ